MAQSMGSRNGYMLSNLIISLLVGIFMIIVVLWSVSHYVLSVSESLTLLVVCIVMYLVMMYVLLRTGKVRRKREIPFNQSDVVKQIVNEIVEKEKDRREKVLDIPEDKYVGSSQNKTYHLKDCKIAKSIKDKFRLSSNSPAFFINKKFRPCRVCMKKTI